MSAVDWAALLVALTTLISAQAALSKFLTKHYLHELKPNGGGSIKDKVDKLEDKSSKLEEKVDFLTDLIKEVLKK